MISIILSHLSYSIVPLIVRSSDAMSSFKLSTQHCVQFGQLAFYGNNHASYGNNNNYDNNMSCVV